MWREPEETWTLNAIFHPRHYSEVTASQHAAVKKEQPNKYRKRDIYKSPHPRQPSNPDMRTDGLCVCVTLCSMHVLCVCDDWRQGRRACMFVCPPHIPENKQWLTGWHCSRPSRHVTRSPPTKSNEQAIQAFTAALSSLHNLWLGLC